jgi:nicotinate-nucleotide adenylyltransferase
MGIFGGAFDPPHLGHVAIAQKAFSILLLDNLLWLPSFSPPHRKASETPFQHRVGMLEALVQNLPGHAVCDLEATLPAPHYAIQSLETLIHSQNQFHSEPAEVEWHWILGADQWETFSTWHRPADLLRLAQFWIYPRPGSPLPKDLPESAHLLSGPLHSEASSTWRESHQKKSEESTSQAIHPSVAAYIAAHGLYGKP